MTDSRRRRLGEILIEAGVLTQPQLQGALHEQKKWGGKLGRMLVEMGFIDEDTMVRALSRQLSLPTVDLDRIELPPSITHLLRVDLAERYGVFPIGADAKTRTLRLAMSDPTNIDTMKAIGLSTRAKIQVAIATGTAIDRAIRRFYYGDNVSGPMPPAGASRYRANEPSFDLTPGAPSGPMPMRPSAPRPPPGAVPPDPLREIEAGAAQGELHRLSERLTSLERQSAAQVRALRTLVELLMESGLVSRDEFVARANRPD